MISQMVNLPLPLDYEEACNSCWKHHHWCGMGNLTFVLQQDKEEWYIFVKHDEGNFDALLIGGLTTIIG
jgi:hypothetical protein